MRGLLRRLYRAVMRPLLRLVPRDRSRKDVLFLCQNGLMADYLGPVWECIRDDERLRCWLTFPNEEATKHELPRVRERLPIPDVSLRRAYVQPFDLVITADHGHEEVADGRRCPAVYTGHGITGKVVEGEEGDYSYGPRSIGADGRPRYSSMFEAAECNRDRVVRDRPEYAKVIDVVGSLQDDRLLNELPGRDEIRAELGYAPEDKVVFVLGSWGPQSLFHVIGDGLIAAARELLDDWKFTLCVHPHEYRPKPGGERVWGEYLRELVTEGIRVREPAESWIPHMVACDVIITDHTSLAVYGALAGKPMIYSPVPDRFIQKGTSLWKLRAMCRVLDDPSQLGAELERAMTQFPFEQLEALAREINSRPGRSRELVRAVIYRLLGIPSAAAQDAAPSASAKTESYSAASTSRVSAPR